MGQCVSSGEEGPGRGGGRRERREEARSLMKHEGGYQEGQDGLLKGGDRPHHSARWESGYSVSHEYERGRENGRAAAEFDLPGRQTRELMDVASGAICGLERQRQHPARLTLPVQTEKGEGVMKQLSKAYRWRDQFEEPSPEFLALMDRLYMECQLHLTALSSRGDLESRREADTIVSEMVSLRNYWGPQLLPSSTCNAFVRERIPLTLGADQRQFRIDCAQFFEPVPFYGNQQSSCPGELMKLYRFSVYNVTTNEVVLRYYLERSNITQLYHVLCFMDENCHGQVKPYGTEPPSYWEVRQSMLEDVQLRLLSGLSPGGLPAPLPLAVTIFPTHQATPGSADDTKTS